MRLLLVEDDLELTARLIPTITAAGFAVDHADNGVDAEFLGNEEPYDVIVLDLGLPGRPGMEVLSNWRRKGLRTPVIILTARDSWNERVAGLKAGADDYLGKPFHVEELLARLDAVIRRAGGQVTSTLHAGDLYLDEDRQELRRGDTFVCSLTGTEYRLLRYFILNPGKILSKTRLTEHVYDQDFDRDSNLIEVYIRRLRSKIGEGYIRTLRGQGYVFEVKQP